MGPQGSARLESTYTLLATLYYPEPQNSLLKWPQDLFPNPPAEKQGQYAHLGQRLARAGFSFDVYAEAVAWSHVWEEKG